MSRKRASVQQIALEADVDLDEALINLWDAGFDYVTGPGDLLRKGDVNRARRVLGVATRRELASREYWRGLLDITDQELTDLLVELGIKRASAEVALSKKAIHRLQAEVRRRGMASLPSTISQEHEAGPEKPPPPLEWQIIGHERDLRILTTEQVCAIHYALVEDFSREADPIDPAGVRSEHLLASAVSRPQTSAGKVLKYPTVEMAAAALLHALVHDHPFHNGNKRTALVAMLAFLDENGFLLTCDEDALFKLVLQLAQHALTSGARTELPDREVLAVARWLHSRSRWVEKGDRPLPWRRLRQTLAEYGCTLEFPGGVGNRMNIARVVQKPRRIFGGTRQRILSTQTYYGDEGSEIDKSAINKIRHDLELDDLHGIDSATFYDHAPASPSEFIVKYRKTLKRLARL